jgi:hypothetical protein
MQIMTRLPASEEAFASGQEENSPFLDEVMKGAPYGGFSGSIILSHVLKAIMSHVHLIRPSDRPEDAMHGAFWKRHRLLDNQLSSLFMFMPDRFRLPDNLRDPLATYINLNFHASVICLHHVALEMIEKHELDDSLRKDSRYLLKNAAEEIASIVKMTSHRSSLFVRASFRRAQRFRELTKHIEQPVVRLFVVLCDNGVRLFGQRGPIFWNKPYRYVQLGANNQCHGSYGSYSYDYMRLLAASLS